MVNYGSQTLGSRLRPSDSKILNFSQKTQDYQLLTPNSRIPIVKTGPDRPTPGMVRDAREDNLERAALEQNQSANLAPSSTQTPEHSIVHVLPAFG